MSQLRIIPGSNLKFTDLIYLVFKSYKEIKQDKVTNNLLLAGVLRLGLEPRTLIPKYLGNPSFFDHFKKRSENF
jgi:hypothetical protein